MELAIIVIDNQTKFNVTKWIPNDGGEKDPVISLRYRNAIAPCKKPMPVPGVIRCIRIADIHDNFVINIDYAISSSRIPGKMDRSVAFLSGARRAREGGFLWRSFPPIASPAPGVVLKAAFSAGPTAGKGVDSREPSRREGDELTASRSGCQWRTNDATI